MVLIRNTTIFPQQFIVFTKISLFDSKTEQSNVLIILSRFYFMAYIKILCFKITLFPSKEKKKNFRFTLTTNGVLIDDDVIDFANKEMSNVVLSLDGRKEVHDRFRVDYAGNGSWDKIVPKFQKLVNARGGKDYYMRGTFTHHNPDFVKDIEEMLRLGFTELSMEPVVCPPTDPYALTEDDMPIIFEQYEILAKEISIVKPNLCVCFGDRANSIMYDVTTEHPELLITSIKLPHLSGTARGAIKNQFKILDKIGGATADNIAEVYAKEIISHIELLK